MGDLINKYKEINKNSVVLNLWNSFWLFFSINLIKIDLDDKSFINILKFIIFVIIVSAYIFNLILKIKKIKKFNIDNNLYNFPVLLNSLEYKSYNRNKYILIFIFGFISSFIAYTISYYYYEIIFYFLSLIVKILDLIKI